MFDLYYALDLVPLGLALQRLGFPSAMAATTMVTGYDPTSLQVVTMKTTSSDKAMPLENEYLANMVKLWQWKQSQAAAPTKCKGWHAVVRQKAAASSLSARPSTGGVRTAPPSSPMRRLKW